MDPFHGKVNEILVGFKCSDKMFTTVDFVTSCVHARALLTLG